MILILIVLLVILFAGGGYGYRTGWEGPQYGGLFGLVLIVLLILWLTGNLHTSAVRLN